MRLIFELNLRLVDYMANEGKGRLFRRKDGKYLIYLPKDVAEDSMFPLKTQTSLRVKVSFKIGGETLHIEKWSQSQEA